MGGAGDFVNFGGYSTYRGPDGSTLYRIGGLSVPVSNGPFNTPSGNSNGYFGEAFSFTMSSEMGADFRLGVAVDSVGSGTYAPDYVTLYNSSIGSTYSTNLPRNGSADMVFFDVSAEAGETFSAAVWQLASTDPNLAAISMVTFDVSRYKFNVATGQIQTNSVVLSGAPAALVKLGDGNLVLANANTYGGDTRVDGGRLVIVHRDALGGTSNGTVVASGAQLRMNTLAETIFAAEPLTLSGDGLAGSVGGSLRNAANNNTWKGKITLAADATIGAHSGTTLTLDVDSGDALDLAGFNLVIDGAGTVQINDSLAGSGLISRIGGGNLVINRSDLTATIKSNSVVVAFSSLPVDGTYDVLPGPLNDASLATRDVTGLASGTTGTLTNNPNLQVVVTSGATNQKPVVDGGQSFTTMENSSFGTLVGTLTATDGDGNELSGWTIVSGNENNVFALDPDTGALTVAGTVDYEIAGYHTLTVTVLDGTDTSEIATVTVLVVNVAEFSDVFGSQDPVSDSDGDGISNLMAYALGAAGSNASVAKPTVALSNGSLVLTAIVRTDDPNLTVVGEAVTDLENYTSGNSVVEVPGVDAADQDGVPVGCKLRTFSVEQGSDAKKFLRLKASLAQ
jgi:autotransporter-associated beta strand protein